MQFKLEGSGSVYLDDVFFKSETLQFGNPTEARRGNTLEKNFLIEKPQYTISYNSSTNTPNWVGWKLDESWLGTTSRPSFAGFAIDPALDNTSFKKVNQNDYTESGFDRGHLSASADRSRSNKDLLATYLTTNILPFNPTVNQSPALWSGLEADLRDRVDDFGQSFYIFAGGRGSNGKLPNTDINIPSRVWKVVLGFNRGSTSQFPDFAFAVDIENDVRSAGKSWRDYQVSIKQLQQQLNAQFITSGLKFDFLSNVNDLRQKEFLENIGTRLNAPLMAVDGISITSSTSIRHDGVLEESTFDERTFPGMMLEGGKVNIATQESRFGQVGILEFERSEVSIAKVGISQVGIPEISFDEFGFSKTCPSKISSPESCQIPKVSPFEIGVSQVGIIKPYLFHGGFTQIGTTQVSPSKGLFEKGYATQVGSAQVHSLEVHAIQVGLTKIDIPQIQSKRGSGFSRANNDPGEVSFSRSVALQQLLKPDTYSSHNYALQNTTVPTWLSYLGGTTPFNLNIEVRDLPTGQLAEAQVTGFAADGTPNAGTLLLDHNGNDLGWFIDPTPWENSEFNQTLSDSAYRATTSPAAGRYDLLTTILHEMGHLAGLIQGNPAYDLRIQQINGTPTFVGNGFSASLTHDGSHLDPSVKANHSPWIKGSVGNRQVGSV